MIYAKAGSSFKALLTDASTGLVGTLATRINDTDGGEVLPRSTSGIAEVVPGNYRLERQAPETHGDYLLIWDKDPDGKDLAPGDIAVEELRVSHVAAPSEATTYRPSIAEVASILASRTFVKGTLVGSDNNMAGTFTAETRPTEGQVEALVDQALTEIAPRIIDNDDTIDATYAIARTAAARRTALLVLISFFSDELEQGNSAYDELRQLYLDALEALGDGQPDTNSAAKGIYSIPLRSEAYDLFGAGELLP